MGSAPGHRAPGDGRGRCPQGFGSRVRSPSRQPRVRSSRVGMGAFRRPEPGLRLGLGEAGGHGTSRCRAGSGRAVQKARGPRPGPEPLNRAPKAVNFGKSCFIFINCPPCGKTVSVDTTLPRSLCREGRCCVGAPVQTSLAYPGVSVNRLHPSGAADFSSVQGESTPVPGMGSSEEHRGQQDQ